MLSTPSAHDADDSRTAYRPATVYLRKRVSWYDIGGCVDKSEVRPRIVALWSAPRCRSTAFFRMMCERGDFQVLHEPFSYLAEFGQVEVDGETVRSERRLMDAIRELGERGRLFFKDTTDERYPGVLADERFLAGDVCHTFIIRSPLATIASYYAINPRVQRHQIGFEALYELFCAVSERTGVQPVVMDADDLVTGPHEMVRAYCEHVGLPYVREALGWQPEDRREWQPSRRWHLDVSSSSGFHQGQRESGVDITGHPVLSGYLQHHLPFYERLFAARLRA